MVERMAKIFLTEDEEQALIELYRVHLIRVDSVQSTTKPIFMRLAERVCEARIEMEDVNICDKAGKVVGYVRWPADMNSRGRIVACR